MTETTNVTDGGCCPSMDSGHPELVEGCGDDCGGACDCGIICEC